MNNTKYDQSSFGILMGLLFVFGALTGLATLVFTILRGLTG